MFIDSHCHLDRLKLSTYDNNLDAAIQAARDSQVSGMLCVCIDLEHAQDVLSIAERHADIWASVGVHPGNLDGHLPTVDELVNLADRDKIVAIGETGLDYYYGAEQKETQIGLFETQLEVSRRVKKPTIVHTREAREDTLHCIKNHGDIEVGGVLHCFTESWEMAKAALDLNYYISFSGIITFKNASELREVVKNVPLDRILIETDSPYLAPVPYRGKPNEPKYVPYVAGCIAELKGISVDEVADITATNFHSLFLED